MANRVTGSEVKEVINTSLLAAAVEPFILGANAIITGRCSAYSAAEQKELERWLTAHFVSIRDPGRSAVVEQNAGQPSQKYALVGGLSATPYGCQVLILDYKGKLTDLGSGKANASMFGLGTTNSDFD
jgi:hypothetical protein